MLTALVVKVLLVVGSTFCGHTHTYTANLHWLVDVGVQGTSRAPETAEHANLQCRWLSCIELFDAVAGYVSFQNPNRGSWFVQALCHELEAKWRQLEMIQMLTKVCRVLAYNHSSYTPSNPSTHNLKQISSVTTTLTKAIRFQP